MSIVNKSLMEMKLRYCLEKLKLPPMSFQEALDLTIHSKDFANSVGALDVAYPKFFEDYQKWGSYAAALLYKECQEQNKQLCLPEVDAIAWFVFRHEYIVTGPDDVIQAAIDTRDLREATQLIKFAELFEVHPNMPYI